MVILYLTDIVSQMTKLNSSTKFQFQAKKMLAAYQNIFLGFAFNVIHADFFPLAFQKECKKYTLSIKYV